MWANIRNTREANSRTKSVLQRIAAVSTGAMVLHV
jgi:hypothetical protein